MYPAKILLVDDDAVQRKLNRRRLEDAGYRVDTACDAEDALDHARSDRPDLIVSDVLMGEVDGFGFCRRLDEDAALSSVPVVLLSAHYGTDSDVKLAKTVGAWTLLRRTGDFRAELQAVRNCLGERVRPSRPEIAVSRDAYEQHLRSNAVQMNKLVEQTRAAEQRAQILFENANDLISVITPEGVIIEVNRRWEEHSGAPRSELVGKHIDDFGPDNAAPFRDAVASGASQHTVQLPRPSDGTVRDINFSSRVIEIDGERLVLSIGRDVTAQVQAQRTLAATEALYRSMIECVPDIVFRIDETKRIEYASPALERITGYTIAEMNSAVDLWQSRVHVEDLPSYLASAAKLYCDREKVDVEYRFQTRDGRWIWLQLRGTPIVEDGRFAIVGAISDITQRHTLEQSFREAQKMEAIGMLSSGIAHDFNNLLAVIVANSHFLLEDLAESDPRRADAEEIEAAASRAAALTRQLLAFSRRQVLELTCVDLGSVVTGLGKLLRRLIGEDIELAITEGSSGSVRADVGQLEQVVLNLAVNARDAMPQGGKLQIGTSTVALDETNAIAGVPCGRYVKLSVRDSGTGMCPETKLRLFEPFFTTKERGRGTGLGLSTCYGIVKQFNGHLVVDSTLGEGSVFEIYLPRIDAEAQPVRRDSSSHLATHGSETVLLIEDEDQVRTAVARMLGELGYQVMSARSSDEAHAFALSAGVIDLIISDVVMPGGSGIAAVERVSSVASQARVLMISGYTDHTLLRANELGDAVHVLQKPFTPDTLGRKVREILDR